MLEVLARRWPKEFVESNLRRLPVRGDVVAAGPTGTLQPLAIDSYCLQLQVSGALQAKLELARDLMSHANPSGDLAVVVERALDVLIEKLRARRFGQPKGMPSLKETEPGSEPQKGPRPSDEPRPGEGPRRRGHVAHAVRRQVLERDGLCCSYVSTDGHRCEARAFLKLDHERAWVKGGADSVENLRVLCRAHNQLRAEQEFGARVPAKVG